MKKCFSKSWLIAAAFVSLALQSLVGAQTLAPRVTPEHAQSANLTQQAVRLIQANRFVEAESVLQTAVQLDPSNALAQRLLIDVRMRREEDTGKVLRDKLAAMMVDEVDFKAVPLNAVVEYLAEETRRQSPDGQGVNFVLKVPEAMESAPITFKLRRVPLLEVLNYTCKFSGTEPRFEKFAVMIAPAPKPQPAAATP
jgi:hypothetical protein